MEVVPEELSSQWVCKIKHGYSVSIFVNLKCYLVLSIDTDYCLCLLCYMRVTHGTLITELFYFQPRMAGRPAVVQTEKLQDITWRWELALELVVWCFIVTI